MLHYTSIGSIAQFMIYSFTKVVMDMLCLKFVKHNIWTPLEGCVYRCMYFGIIDSVVSLLFKSNVAPISHVFNVPNVIIDI